MLIGKRIPWRHGMKLPNGLIHVFGKSDTEIVQSVPAGAGIHPAPPPDSGL